VEKRQMAAKVDGLEVHAVFGEDAEWLRIGLYYPDDAIGEPEMEAFAPNLYGPRWRKGQRTTQTLPLRDGIKPGCYRLEVEACGPGGVCGRSAAAKLRLSLPDGGKCQGP